MNREERYRELLTEAKAALEGEADPIVWMASLSCLIRRKLGFFWVGFYRVVDSELVIGPYQGTFGCTRISFERGVCGACARAGETVIVKDVHQFSGHIACDSHSNSEIVVPVKDRRGRLRAVLDIDSEAFSDFDEVDRRHLEEIVRLMEDLQWSG